MEYFNTPYVPAPASNAMQYYSTPDSCNSIQELSTHPYLVFRDHATSKNDDTQVVMMEAIRAAHPSLHITTFEETNFDVFGWAHSGHAHITLLPRNDRFLTSREYMAAEDRLTDKVTFGQYRLVFKEKTSLLYRAEWSEGLLRRKARYFYLLSSKADVDEIGHHSTTADALLAVIGKWTTQLHDEIYVFDNGDWDKDKKLWKTIKSSSWDDLVLDPIMKRNLVDDVHGFFNSKAMYREYAVPWKRGIIFHGTPGCGKTMTIKALMKSLEERPDKVSSLAVRSFRTCAGPEDGIKSIFYLAREMTPCLLIFEDLDSLVVDKARSYFLNHVDGLESNDGILMIASTNHLERLDPSISKRPSRFDRKYHFDLPDSTQRFRYCEQWRAKVENAKVDFNADISQSVAKMTQGFSYAYLKELFVQSLLSVARKHEHVDLADDLRNSDNDGNTIPSTPNPSEQQIPETLRGNPLMHALCDQIAALRIDLDRALEDKEGTTKKEDEGEE